MEADRSARRADKRTASAELGHLHAFDRPAVRSIARRAGMTVDAELTDPLPLAVHRFEAASPSARARGLAKWATRRALTAVPPVGERLITLHYAALLSRV